MKLHNLIIAGALAGLAGCATTTSGPTVPSALLTKLAGSPVLMNDPGILTIYATTQCSAGAAQEYRLSVAACEGELASVVGGAIIPANAVAGIELACQVLGYTNASNQLTVPTSVTVGPLTAGGPCFPSTAVPPSSLPKLKS